VLQAFLDIAQLAHGEGRRLSRKATSTVQYGVRLDMSAGGWDPGARRNTSIDEWCQAHLHGYVLELHLLNVAAYGWLCDNDLPQVELVQDCCLAGIVEPHLQQYINIATLQ
jgi:hypothetical protein